MTRLFKNMIRVFMLVFCSNMGRGLSNFTSSISSYNLSRQASDELCFANISISRRTTSCVFIYFLKDLERIQHTQPRTKLSFGLLC